MNSPAKTRPLALLTSLVALVASGCASPFSDFQSARLLAPGQTEITASASHVRGSDDDSSGPLQDEYGLQVACGLSDRVKLRAKFFHVTGYGDRDVSALGVGPKFSLVENKVAFYTPVGFGFGGGLESSETWQWQPTPLVTGRLADNVEVTGSTKAQFWFEDLDDPNVAFNVGLGLSPNLDRWAIRPELGFLVNPGEEGR